MENENNKCDKYESYFVFQDEEKFKEHLNSCENCKQEHERYLKISSLVKEVAPIYLEREKENKIKMMNAAKKLAACFVLFVSLTAFTGYKMYDNYVYQVSLEQESTVSEMGLPIDEYGFLSL